VKPPDFRRVRAVHPHWNGFLRLSTRDNSVTHEIVDNSGEYEIDEDILKIIWGGLGSDTFLLVDGAYLHEDLIQHVPNINGIEFLNIGGTVVKAESIDVAVPNSSYKIKLRLQESDVMVFTDIFIRGDYNSPELPESVRTIVDLGANTGLSTVFFGLKYPAARILAVEPDPENFSLLEDNTVGLGPRVELREAAVWTRDGAIGLQSMNADGQPLGAWGIQVREAAIGAGDRAAPCFKLSTLIQDACFGVVDILKVDIEGAERDVFAAESGEWLHRVDLLIVETHDRLMPGCESAVRRALEPGFRELRPCGENLLFRRRDE
jgi:FkbM family methyltransferase